MRNLIVVEYRDEGNTNAGFQYLRISRLPFAIVLKRLRDAIEVENLQILAEINSQAILAGSGYKIGPACQIMFFHPRLMARLLTADPSAFVEAPLKFSIVESEQQVIVRWQYPTPAYASYGSGALAELGDELSATCARIVESALD